MMLQAAVLLPEEEPEDASGRVHRQEPFTLHFVNTHETVPTAYLTRVVPKRSDITFELRPFFVG